MKLTGLHRNYILPISIQNMEKFQQFLWLLLLLLLRDRHIAIVRRLETGRKTCGRQRRICGQILIQAESTVCREAKYIFDCKVLQY